MNFTEAFDAAYKGSKVRRSVWKPGGYLFVDDVTIRVHYPNGIRDVYLFNKEEFYATDWKVVE